MVGERRVVTMLFATSVAPTAAAARFDLKNGPDREWGVHKMGRSTTSMKAQSPVSWVTGYWLFGAPIAHEDDPQRAVLAGLQIIIGPGSEQMKASGRRHCRASALIPGWLSSGRSVPICEWPLFRPGRCHINLAARMEQTTPPGTVPDRRTDLSIGGSPLFW